jgi:hypothetical protein
MVSVKITKSTNSGKKLMAVFIDDNGKKIKTVHFGQSGASDYTKNKDEERKKLYLARHKANENWDDYKSAGSLSRYILWNKTTLSASIADYKTKFNLK